MLSIFLHVVGLVSELCLGLRWRESCCGAERRREGRGKEGWGEERKDGEKRGQKNNGERGRESCCQAEKRGGTGRVENRRGKAGRQTERLVCGGGSRGFEMGGFVLSSPLFSVQLGSTLKRMIWRQRDNCFNSTPPRSFSISFSPVFPVMASSASQLCSGSCRCV